MNINVRAVSEYYELTIEIDTTRIEVGLLDSKEKDEFLKDVAHQVLSEIGDTSIVKGILKEYEQD